MTLTTTKHVFSRSVFSFCVRPISVTFLLVVAKIPVEGWLLGTLEVIPYISSLDFSGVLNNGH